MISKTHCSVTVEKPIQTPAPSPLFCLLSVLIQSSVTQARLRGINTSTIIHHFFFGFDFDLDDAAGAEFVDATLDARDGAAEVALLPVTDLTLSRALF